MGLTGRITQNVYLLRLGEERGWALIANSATRRWCDRFAQIMQLEAQEKALCNHWPRIFFIRKVSEKDGLKELPQEGWIIQDLWLMRIWCHKTLSDIICEIGDEDNYELDIIRMWTALYLICLGVQKSGGLILHSGLIKRDEKGILLVGPGGSGKSTLCQRIPGSWAVLSDDQVLICKTKEGYLAQPLPTWSDYLWQRSRKNTWNVGQHIPLAAIFFIEQAQSDAVFPTGQGQTAVFIQHSAIDAYSFVWGALDVEIKRTVKKRIFENACRLARTIPGYILSNRLNGRSWEEIEKIPF